MSTTSWTVLRTEHFIHVLPDHDVIRHEETVSCPCSPGKEPQMNGPHVAAMMITHKALDGRD